MGRFYSANFSVPTSADLKVLEKEKENSMRPLAFTEVTINRGDRAYKLGDKMKSRIETEYSGTLDSSSRTQYRDAFPFGRADSFGNCNNYGSVYFM